MRKLNALGKLIFVLGALATIPALFMSLIGLFIAAATPLTWDDCTMATGFWIGYVICFVFTLVATCDAAYD